MDITVRVSYCSCAKKADEGRGVDTARCAGQVFKQVKVSLDRSVTSEAGASVFVFIQ